MLIIGKNILRWAQSNLFKDHAAWSGKDIKIKYSQTREVSDSKRNENYLKLIADESKIFLEDQSKKDEG